MVQLQLFPEASLRALGKKLEPAERSALWMRHVRAFIDDWRVIVRQVEICRNGNRYRLVARRGGPSEFYRIGPDGLEMFAGYARDLLGTVDDRANGAVQGELT